jgi:hypothetical protein
MPAQQIRALLGRELRKADLEVSRRGLPLASFDAHEQAAEPFAERELPG